MRRLVLLLGWLIFPAMMFADCELQDSDVTYDLFIHNKHVGEIRQHIHLANKHYYIDNKTKISFLFLRDRINESIKGNVDGGKYQPTSYKIKDARKQNEMQWQFSPNKGLIQGRIGDHFIKQHHAKWPIYDTSSYQMALRCALRRKSFKQASYRVFSDGKIKRYDAKLTNKQHVVQTGNHVYMTTEVRVFIKPGGQTALLWFANTHDHSLVQSSLRQGGEDYVFSRVSEAKFN